MERLADLHEESRVAYDAEDSLRDTVETYVEQADLRLGREDSPLSVTVTVSPGDSLTGNVLTIKPTYGRDEPLYVADTPVTDAADEPVPLDGRLGYVESVNGQDYHVTVDSEPVEELLPDDRWRCGPAGPMPLDDQ